MRHEFTRSVGRAADLRAGGRCEAVGAVYGLEPGTRCTRPVGPGKQQRDHYPVPAGAEDSATLDNCVVCCLECHAFKTAHFDIPAEAKIKRVQRKHGRRPDTRKPRPKMRGPGFRPQHRPISSRKFQRKGDR